MSFAWKSLFLASGAYLYQNSESVPPRRVYVRRDRALDRHRPDGLSILQVRAHRKHAARSRRRRPPALASRGSTHCSTAPHRWLLLVSRSAVGHWWPAGLGNVRKALHSTVQGSEGAGPGGQKMDRSIRWLAAPNKHSPVVMSLLAAACGSGIRWPSQKPGKEKAKGPRPSQQPASQPARRLAWRWRSIDSCPPLPPSSVLDIHLSRLSARG